MTVDVLVVGGGPAGLYAARRLAHQGFRVLVCEEHAAFGEPVHCTGVLAAESFDRYDLPRDAILNGLADVRFVSPAGVTVSYSTPRPEAIVIDRGRFDRALADRALAAGAVLRAGTRVTSLTIDAGAVRAVAGGEPVVARLALLACGATYAVQRRLGLGFPRRYLHTAQRELKASRARHVELHFGSGVAPGGFAWAVPVLRPEGPMVRVGVMAAQDAPACYRRIVARIRDAWGIRDDGAGPRLKILPLGAIERTYADRLLAIGDAAGLVKPTTGGGIYYSILSADLAADVGGRALRADRVDSASLSAYEVGWRNALADEFDAQHALRDIATRMTDREIDDLFELAQTDGIMPIVRRTARFNQHRDLIVALLKHPPARRVLFRAIGV